MESVAFIQWCLDHLNYWTITLLMTIESSFIPFPSEVVVPPAAYKAAVNEELNIYLVVLFATLESQPRCYYQLLSGPLAGTSHRLQVRQQPFRTHVPRSMKPKCSMPKNISTSTEHSPLLSVASIPAVRQLISIPAGLARMKLHTFPIYTTLGAGLWNTILAAIGYYLSTVPGIESEEQLLAKVTEYSHELGYCFIVIGVFIVGFLVYKGMKKKK